jgi:hypothetical protein
MGFVMPGSEEDASEVSELSAGLPWAAVELFDILRFVAGPARQGPRPLNREVADDEFFG